MERDKGHESQGREVGARQHDPAALFGSTPHFAYTYRKAEKIVTALYMVTGYLSDEEPLKWKVRRIGGDLLTLTNVLKDTYSSKRDENLHALRSQLVELLSMIDIARYAGLVSEMNAGILKNELEGLMELYAEGKEFGAASKMLRFDPSFFDEAIEVPARPRELVKDKESRRPSQPLYKRQEERREREERGPYATSEEKKDKRRKTIIDLIRKRGNVTIKDVSTVIRDCSEKTIQRELLGLVGEGVLAKEGERRWSRYSLARA